MTNQRQIQKGRAWTDEDWAIYRRNRSAVLDEMLIADRYESRRLAFEPTARAMTRRHLYGVAIAIIYSCAVAVFLSMA